MPRYSLFGAIAGDIIGSIYERQHFKSTDFPLFSERCQFTDDTVMTIAVADCLLHERPFAQTLWEYGRRYPNRGYGGRFGEWLRSDNPQPYNSFGNGSAMRVAGIGLAAKSLAEVLTWAEASAEVSHNHPEGIKGAQALAAAIFWLKQGKTKNEMRALVEGEFGYHLGFSIEEIRPSYGFDVSCQGSVPQAMMAFLDSEDYEQALRLAISLGGDSDTLACMAGALANAYYGELPAEIVQFCTTKLDAELLSVLNDFDRWIA